VSAGVPSRRRALAGWLAVLAAATSLACSQEEEGAASPALGESAAAAPDFEVTRLGGGRLSLSQQRGKVVLIDFWATWCRPCIEEIPALNAAYERHRGDGFEIVAIAVDDPLTPEQLERWTAERDVRYPVGLGTFELAERYGAFQFPHQVFVGANGEILEELPPGMHTEDELEAAIARHLAPR